MSHTTIEVHEPYQDHYSYELTAKAGQDFAEGFEPDLTPKQMLQLGVFGGNYFKEVPNEFPASWFTDVPLTSDGTSQAKLNYFQVNASQPLKVWQQKGWIHPDDPLGWFLWYCRYYQGRRLGKEDERQIKRWRAIRRHVGQIKKACKPGDELCRPTQRQALLHWAYDARKI